MENDFNIPNVFITGHHAYLSEEALTNTSEATNYNLDSWRGNKDTENELAKLIDA